MPSGSAAALMQTMSVIAGSRIRPRLYASPIFLTSPSIIFYAVTKNSPPSMTMGCARRLLIGFRRFRIPPWSGCWIFWRALKSVEELHQAKQLLAIQLINQHNNLVSYVFRHNYPHSRRDIPTIIRASPNYSIHHIAMKTKENCYEPKFCCR